MNAHSPKAMAASVIARATGIILLLCLMAIPLAGCSALQQEHLLYTNEFFGFEASLPPEFTQGDDKPVNAGEEVMLFAENPAGDSIEVVLYDVSKLPEGADVTTWASIYKDSVNAALTEAGEMPVVVEDGETTLAGVPCSHIYVESDSDAGQQYREYFFMVKENDGLRIDLAAQSKETLQALKDGFYAL